MKPYLGIDKAYHFGVCLVASIIHPWLAIGLGIGKEVGDHYNPNNKWDWWDIAYDALGTAVGSVGWWLLWW